jgi:heat shock protein HslJ
MTRTPSIPTLVILAFVTIPAFSGCGPGKEERGSAAAVAAVPTYAEAAGATLRGLEGDSETVTLADGRWDGPPFVAGSASRPSVYLVPGFLVPWNADGEGPEEAVVLIGENSGGSGEYIYLGLIAREGPGVVNRATAMLGDRVQVVSVEPSGGRFKMTLLRAGPEGALCCPDEVAAEEWEFRNGALSRLPAASPPHPLTTDIMAGVEWTLLESDTANGTPGQDVPEPSAPRGGVPPAPAGPPAITLRYADGRFQGNTGCNRYFMPVSPGELPGDLVPGPAGSTRMACPDSAGAEAEARYLARLGSVVKFGFSACRLMLMYEGEEGTGVLYFRRPQGL